MTSNYVPPAINLVSFNCPHSTCGALAKRFWFSAYAAPMKKDATPLILDADKATGYNPDHAEDAEERDRLQAAKMATGRPFIWGGDRSSRGAGLNNVFVAQ